MDINRVVVDFWGPVKAVDVPVNASFPSFVPGSWGGGGWGLRVEGMDVGRSGWTRQRLARAGPRGRSSRGQRGQDN